MASVPVLLLHLLLVSLASASHNFGGTATYTYKGKNPDGTYRVEFRTKDTFDGCQNSHYWSCYSGNCGRETTTQTGKIDNSTNSPRYTRQWCETETVSTRALRSDKPFTMSAGTCCWIQTRNYVSSWILMTAIDLGVRSDTKNPNMSPDIAILPFIRVPQNCPRRYDLMAFDPDGDQVRCRFGTHNSRECSGCNRPSGFTLNENSCTLSYYYSTSDTRVYAFEMVVEDFPQRTINLQYSDRSTITKSPLMMRRDKRYLWPATTAPVWHSAPNWSSWWRTAPAPTSPAASYWWSWWRTTPAPTSSQTPNWWSWWRTTPAPTSSPTPNWWSWWRTTPAPTSSPTPNWWSWWRTAPAPASSPTPNWWQRSSTTSQTSPTSAATSPSTTSATTSPSTTSATTSPPMTPMMNMNAAPLSKLPLQFSFLVDPPAPSCREGDYLPKLVNPTPANKEFIQAEVNNEMQIKVKGQASYSTINDLLMTGPLNIRSSRISGDTFAIKWTPTSNEAGEFHPICFAIEATLGLNVYHSEMRCVLVKVVEDRVQTTVVCTETSMIVTVDKSTFPRLDNNHLRLNDAKNTACRLTSNSTHVIGIVPLNSCGTEIKEDANNLYFYNEITTVDNMKDVVTRKHLLEVQFSCQYPKRQNLTLAFSIHRENVTVLEKGFGTFTYGFEFYTNSQFQIMEDPRSYPLEYDIGSRIYMEIEATTTVNNTELFVESCSAAPYDIPNYVPTYPIIENGCNVDPTVITHPRSHPREFRFSMEAFKFIGLHDQVYISCQVMMCKAGDPNTRCSRGCLNSSNRPAPRWKREAVSQSGRHFISQGPLRLRGSAESGELPVLNLNLVFIAGCVLAALAMISAVVVYKTKMSGLRYQPLPTQDSDTAQ
ncbi:uncharacterized protein LOC130515209 [Takifugu flavidus]|uniref:uncharacterized protein LOC130515209 n=1 Tax=Takifugu flavidus TaxID=433684 RepID=UPI0025440665|nr:uncharacterized protein LOC130515209 [Takifugu flavidus]